MSLIDERAERVQRGTAPLSGDVAEGLAKGLAKEIPDWTLKDTSIERSFEFESFRPAVDFVNRVADIAEREDHHPDIWIGYNRVKLVFSTHRIGGLSRNDFILAAKIDQLMVR